MGELAEGSARAADRDDGPRRWPALLGHHVRVTDTNADTEAHRAVVDSMRGRRVIQVSYYGLYLQSEDPTAWDFGEWHHPLMGVELILEPDEPYSIVWGSTFFKHDLEVFRDPMTKHHIGIGEPEGPPVHDVSGHHAWAPLLAEPLIDVQVIWLEDHPDQTARIPVAVRLHFPAGDAWLVAAVPLSPDPNPDFLVTGDEVIVAFAADFLPRRLGIQG
jgi:hypothetical protein